MELLVDIIGVMTIAVILAWIVFIIIDSIAYLRKKDEDFDKYCELNGKEDD